MQEIPKLLLAGVATLGLALIQLPAPVTARAAAMPSDFNGDGYADLAIAIPDKDKGSKVHAGAVSVLYGSTRGLTAAGDQLWTADSTGVKGQTSKTGWFGTALSSADFNRDGYADLAIGARGERVGDVPFAGAVHVLYGSRSGLTAAGDQRWTQARLRDVPERDDEFGHALAAGDFDHDGYPDLAIGVSGEDLGDVWDAGLVAIVYGSADGLRAARNQAWTRDTPGIDGTAARAQKFGRTLAAGDLDGDGYDDLAVGAPWDEVGGVERAGAVNVLYGSADGLSAARNQLWTGDSPGVGGDVQAYDQFGWALALGDVDADGSADVAIGAPGPWAAGGRVVTLYGGAGGLRANRAQLWQPGVAGVPGSAESGGLFGQALAIGDFEGDGYRDLAIGDPDGESGVGSVTVLRGGPAGLTSAGAQLWTQTSPGVPGTAEYSDAFGSSLAAATYGRSSRDDLAIGVPREDMGRRYDAGMVNVLYGGASGLSGRNAQSWSQDTPGVLGTAGENDEFGSSLTP